MPFIPPLSDESKCEKVPLVRRAHALFPDRLAPPRRPPVIATVVGAEPRRRHIVAALHVPAGLGYAQVRLRHHGDGAVVVVVVAADRGAIQAAAVECRAHAPRIHHGGLAPCRAAARAAEELLEERAQGRDGGGHDAQAVLDRAPDGEVGEGVEEVAAVRKLPDVGYPDYGCGGRAGARYPSSVSGSWGISTQKSGEGRGKGCN